MVNFKVESNYKPSGDQGQAIEKIAQKFNNGERNVVLQGATGTGKTATTAWIVEKLNRPTLIIEPNKTLAAQLCAEIRELMPNNAVEYFVSYYDYYQPEAYIAQTDTYIQKDSSINDEIEKLRHHATVSLLSRRDTIVIASVSCIYGLGEPQEYIDMIIDLTIGQNISREDLIKRLIISQYMRNDFIPNRGEFRVKGDTIEIVPVYEDNPVRVEFFGDEIETITILDPLTFDNLDKPKNVKIFPASHYVASEESTKKAIKGIEQELDQTREDFVEQKKLIQAERIQMRTKYDLEMIRETGTCKGIENYSMHFDSRNIDDPPSTLLDFFPDDYLLVIDESHITVPQIGAMYSGDQARKRSLVDFGFRLPSAKANRPLNFEEFLQRTGQTLFLSATPGDYEMELVENDTVSQIIRPTGLLDPKIEVRPVKGQIQDIEKEIKKRIERNERTLVTTLTKKMAEELTNYLEEKEIKVQYLHSDVQTIERVNILRSLRKGEYDVVVGINLLREGLDLPEVSLVCILDADKQGFLRSYRSLIQTIGRAARNVNGEVYMYAENKTPQMIDAIKETNRRRQIQEKFNRDNNIDPKPLQKKIQDVTDYLQELEISNIEDGVNQEIKTKPKVGTKMDVINQIIQEIDEFTQIMRNAAQDLQFEMAASYRDKISELKKELKELQKS